MPDLLVDDSASELGTAQEVSLLGLWAQGSELLPSGGARSSLLLALESLVAGFLEAALMVMVIGAGLAVANDEQTVDLDIPLIGLTQLAPGPALTIALTAGVLALALHLHSAWLTSSLSARVLRSARDRAVISFSGASWSRQAQEREGSLQQLVGGIASETSALIVFAANVVAATLALCALFVAALVVDFAVTAVVVVFGGLLMLALRPIGSLTVERAREYVAANNRFSEGIAQWGSFAMELRTFGVEQAEADRLKAENEVTTLALARTRFASRAGGLVLRDIAILLLVGAIAALHLLVDVNLAAAGAVVLLIFRSLSYAQQVQTNLQQVKELSPNLEMLARRLASLETASAGCGRRVVQTVAPIEFRNVGYDYGVDRPGVADVNLEVVRGEALGVVGASGGGKSTLIQVLLRLRPPSRGLVLANGVPYEEISARSWSRLVALVPQEPKLFEGTVAENIAFYRGEFDREQIEAAAEAARVLDEIRQLPHGFDTMLGPRGSGLSGGQKQRIAIARAMVGRPQLLVLDEPTSALDRRAEELLQATIAELRGKVTIVMAAHRLSTLSICDRVIGMHQGRVIAVGALDDVMRRLSVADAAKVVPEAH